MDAATRIRLETLHTSLLCREAALLAEVDAAGTAARRDAGGTEVHDRKDDAERGGDVALREAEAQRDVDELVAVRAALRRLDAGAYGDCADCGAPIPLQRLLVQPAAECCAACQAAREVLPRR